MLRIIDFKGAIPRLHPRLLPENYAQIARNVRLEDGSIGPVRIPGLVATLPADALSFYRSGITWLSWNADVDVTPAPIAANRIYVTGDGAPKMIDTGVVYGLALAKPAAAPALTNLSAPQQAQAESVIYAYTWVTALGEESQPSPLSAQILTSPGVTVRLSGMSTMAAGNARNITAKRIYRSQTTASGATALFFVAEIAATAATYDHSLAAAPLQEVIPSTDYDPPKSTLRGLVSMPNGMMAAFSGKEVFFCEPYQPHAWPVKYSLRVDFDIVGLASFGSSLAILTVANPYLAQGMHPDSMAMEKMDKALPCLSKRGIVDTGYAAYYPSAEGLATIAGDRAEIVTRGLFTREQWQALKPDSFIADTFDGRYVTTFAVSTPDIYDGGTPGVAAPVVQTFDANVFEAGVFE